MVSKGRSNRDRVGFERSGSAKLESVIVFNENRNRHTDDVARGITMLYIPNVLDCDLF